MDLDWIWISSSRLQAVRWQAPFEGCMFTCTLLLVKRLDVNLVPSLRCIPP